MQKYKRLIIASNNKSKVTEIKTLLAHRAEEIVSLWEAKVDVEIEESGLTFLENAIIKAKTIYEITTCPVIADDSGLEVYALGGMPGVYSARYAGEPCDDEKNNRLLLSNLQDKADRRARFVSEIVLYEGKDKLYNARGECEGRILSSPVGKNGFGYDPLFYSTELKKTFGEASAEEKNKVSHRARALEKLVEILCQKR
ncbi:MAG: RdgB/HAM1 family non-canonical purine NTP pyrophosphatase [Christensenellales bacterium]